MRMKLAYSTYIILQVILLIIWTRPDTPKTAATLPTTGLTIGGFISLIFVSYLDHTRSIRPSTPLTVYLGLSVLLDLARVRTLVSIVRSRLLAWIFLASFVVKLAIFLLELVEKRSLLKHEWRCASTEATASVYNRSLFIWLNGLFVRGFQTRLLLDSLPPVDPDILSASQPTTLIERWKKGRAIPYARSVRLIHLQRIDLNRTPSYGYFSSTINTSS